MSGYAEFPGSIYEFVSPAARDAIQLMTVLHAYYDETGTHNSNGVMRLVGIVAPHQAWDDFHKKWCGILNDRPAVDYWHTTCAHTGRLPLSGSLQKISRPDREAKEAKLAALLGSFSDRYQAISVEMDLGEHAANFVLDDTNRAKLESRFGVYASVYAKPMFLMMRVAMKLASEYAEVVMDKISPGHPWSLTTTFEDDRSSDRTQIDLMVGVHLMRSAMRKQEDRWKVGSVSFVPGKGPLAHTPVQAVDLYAWHLNRIGEESQFVSENWEAMSRIKCLSKRVTPGEIRASSEAVNYVIQTDVV